MSKEATLDIETSPAEETAAPQQMDDQTRNDLVFTSYITGNLTSLKKDLRVYRSILVRECKLLNIFDSMIRMTNTDYQKLDVTLGKTLGQAGRYSMFTETLENVRLVMRRIFDELPKAIQGGLAEFDTHHFAPLTEVRSGTVESVFQSLMSYDLDEGFPLSIKFDSKGGNVIDPCHMVFLASDCCEALSKIVLKDKPMTIDMLQDLVWQVDECTCEMAEDAMLQNLKCKGDVPLVLTQSDVFKYCEDVNNMYKQGDIVAGLEMFQSIINRMILAAIDATNKCMHGQRIGNAKLLNEVTANLEKLLTKMFNIVEITARIVYTTLSIANASGWLCKKAEEAVPEATPPAVDNEEVVQIADANLVEE